LFFKFLNNKFLLSDWFGFGFSESLLSYMLLSFLLFILYWWSFLYLFFELDLLWISESLILSTDLFKLSRDLFLFMTIYLDTCLLDSDFGNLIFWRNFDTISFYLLSNLLSNESCLFFIIQSEFLLIFGVKSNDSYSLGVLFGLFYLGAIFFIEF
jgi:hypothetical protein